MNKPINPAITAHTPDAMWCSCVSCKPPTGPTCTNLNYLFSAYKCNEGKFKCQEDGCCYTFTSEDALENHYLLSGHWATTSDEGESENENYDNYENNENNKISGVNESEHKSKSKSNSDTKTIEIIKEKTN
jgi:hypothetical protein